MMLRRIVLSVIMIFAFLFNDFIYANSIQHITLVFDGHPYATLPQNFRSTDNPLKNNVISKKGLASLHLIGSGQFSYNQLKNIRKMFKSTVLIVDLRQESHGFINGLPISWYAEKNWANHGLPSFEIQEVEDNLLNSLKELRYATVHRIVTKSPDGMITKTIPVDVKVKDVASEEELAKHLHMEYKRFYIPDHSAPNKIQARKFIRFINGLPKNTWIYFHCRAGEGRTTTFMVMTDIIRNGSEVSFDDILKRQMLLGGHDFNHLPPKDSFKYPLALERYNFLKSFYGQCKLGLCSIK